MSIDARISRLREKMQRHDYQAYIIPLCDPHQSEYPATYWKSLSYISGFTGSAGTVVILIEHAGLWTDSRYFIQGEQELEGTCLTLHKMQVQGHAGYIEYLRDNLPAGSKVIADGAMISVGQKERWSKQLAEKGVELCITDDFIGSTWEGRPAIPTEAIFEHDVKYAGEDRKEKIGRIRAEMKNLGADHHLITTLDDIAWILNLRGSDVECNPVFVSYLQIDPDKTTLYVEPSKINADLTTSLKADGVFLSDYSNIVTELRALPESSKVLIHKGTINIKLYQALQHTSLVEGKLISRHFKAVKNATELVHFKAAHVKDGVALAQAFKWLEDTLPSTSVSEYDFAMKLAECRSKQEGYYGESFNAIVGYKSNGAIIHYRPMPDTCADIENDGILLVDSGGQYQDGTTDITRTVTFSAPPQKQKNAYTRVLKGHIALSLAQFPKGTTGGQLDILARNALWADGLNYGHGTGHGVGFFLNVHEPPQGFAPGKSERAQTAHVSGMVSSNEPGHYVEGEYGIRIENLIVTKPSEHEGFLDFENITYFPIDTQLVDKSIMTDHELKWLNDYHALVFSKLSPFLDEAHTTWLKGKCNAI